jgi:hypothetical protein
MGTGMSASKRVATIALTTLTAAAAGFGYEQGRKAGAASKAQWANTIASVSPARFMNHGGASASDILERLYKGNLSPDDAPRYGPPKGKP